MNLKDLFVEFLKDALSLGFVIRSYVTREQYYSSQPIDDEKPLLGENQNRTGFIIFNDSPNTVYILFGNDSAKKERYTTQVEPYAEWVYDPNGKPYTGQIMYNPASASSGALQVTEFVKEEEI